MSSHDWDVTIVGAGVIGLACAAAITRPGLRVLVVERHDGICREGSSRNSEVIHAGIYYPQGSLKSLSCVAGRRAIYQRAAERNLGVARCGKVIVAADQSELPALEALFAAGQANDVEGLELVDASRLSELEPGCQGVAALWSPESGIVDSHELARSFQVEAEAAGAIVTFGASLESAEPIADPDSGFTLALQIHGEAEPFLTSSRIVINAAGLGQDRISASLGLDIDDLGYRQYLCKGEWFSVSDRHRGRLSRLVYPIGRAADGGLGVHSCMDLSGGLRLGPDAEWLDGFPERLEATASKAAAFLASGQRLFPWLEPGDLRPDQAGLRPKLSAKDGDFSDFVIAEESEQGFPGWVTLAGIESPGLTAAPDLARRVADLVKLITS